MRTINKFLTYSCLLLSFSSVTAAKNTVVVIPLGDDSQLDEPPSPVATISPSQSDYSIFANTVIEKASRLEWQRQDDDQERNWEEANIYCANLELDSKTDWRLPTAFELQALVDYTASNPSINEVAFTNTTAGSYWSSTAVVNSNSTRRSIGVNFLFGFIETFERTFDLRVRCVR